MDTIGKSAISPVGVVAVAVSVTVAAGAAVYAMQSRNAKAEEDEKPKIGYAEGVVVLSDEEPVDITPQEAITLEYKGNAISDDGKNFRCYIANAIENQYDMYVDIYSDAALTDEIYLSGLFPPGTGFEEITLDEALPSGENTVYVAFTQTEDGGNTIHGQTVVTMNFLVK